MHAGQTASEVHQRTDQGVELMMRFAERTGLGSAQPQRRYLWTDAFAVCNFIALARVTGEQRFAELALRLIDRVHHTLGRHREDDARTGWLSGLAEADGERHPTRGGLRIGKRLPERRPDQAFDEQLEWDRDGQYFHYLTKWMHALDQAARSFRQPLFNLWARELAEAAHGAFRLVRRGDAGPGLAWKMSIDLSRPLVAAMGHHDALDGFITCAQLRATALAFSAQPERPDLEEELRSFGSMLEAGSWATADPLGLGGLLMDACRVEQLMGWQAIPDSRLLGSLLSAALDGLRHHAQRAPLRESASRRLAFRELGLAIGLAAFQLMDSHLTEQPKPPSGDVAALLAELRSYLPLGMALRSFWLDGDHRGAPTWSEHRDINEVMLATSLVPEGFLLLPALS